MMRPHVPKPKHRDALTVPRWVIAIISTVLYPAAHILFPWAIARLANRYGWSEAIPSLWNLLGLIPAACGLVGLAWCVVFHYIHLPSRCRFESTGPALVVGGPYRFSRNPMYLSALTIWTGWAIFYGSPAILVGLLLLWLGFAYLMVPWEERELEERFGDAYREYKRSTPRWVSGR